MSKKIYVLDIGNSAVKLLACNLNGKKVEIVDAQISRLPLDFVGMDDETAKISTWRNCLEKLFEGENPSVKKTLYVSLPSDQTFLRYIALPNIPISKINKIIRFEAEQQIPFLLSDVEWAYDVLPSRKKREVDIVIAAAKKAIVQELMLLLPIYGFSIESLEVGQIVLHNLADFYNLGQDGTVLVDIGIHSTDVVIVYKGMSWGRNIRRGVASLRKAVADKQNLSLSEAEKMIRVCNDRNSAAELDVELQSVKNELHLISGEFIAEISKEISRTINYYFSIVKGAHFSKVLLTGGGAYIKDISALFEKHLEIPTAVADFTACFEFNENIKSRVYHNKNVYNVAFGMICGVLNKKSLSANLLGEIVRNNQILVEKKSRYRFFFVMIFLILLTVMFNVYWDFNIKKTLLRENSVQADKIIFAEKNFKDIRDEINQKVAKLNFVSNEILDRKFKVQILKDVVSLVPDTMWLDGMEYDQISKVLILSGKTPQSLSEINSFSNKIGSLEYVGKVTYDSAKIEDSEDEELVLRSFSIKIDLILDAK